MKETFISVMLVSALVLGLAGCVDRTAKSGTAPPSTCLRDLNTIPEMAAVLKARKNDSEEVQGRPFEGLELALTINGMVRSRIDPDADPDDLCFTENTPENLVRLANALESNALPPTVSFLRGRSIDERMQKEWLKRGNMVGSLGYNKLRGGPISAEKFIDDVLRNDAALAPVWGGSPPAKRYFRFPRTNLRRDRREMETAKAYLKKNNYVVVPSTIELLDHLFSQRYCSALSQDDQSCANLIKANFRSLALDATLKARRIAATKAGRDVKHILAVRANQFTCDNLSELLRWYKALGARFITLDEALSDSFYATDEAGKIVGETRRALREAGNER